MAILVNDEGLGYIFIFRGVFAFGLNLNSILRTNLNLTIFGDVVIF
jgi:hypothetical protein